MSRSQAIFMVRRRILLAALAGAQLSRHPAHGTRHSWLAHLAPPGVDEADMAGHSVETMIARYSHPRRASFEHVRKPVG